MNFDGTNDLVTFGSVPDLTGLGLKTFTIETWFKKTGNGATTTTGTGGITAIPLVTKGRGEGDNSNVDMNYFFGIDSTGVLAADFEECATSMTGCPATATNTDADGGGQNYPAKGSTIIQNNTWYHAAVTYDGRYYKLYLNGIQDGATTDTGANRLPRWDSIQHAGLGTAMTSAGVSGAAGYFQGVLDEARIWNYARSQSEIMTTINQQVASGTGLVARMGMGEGSGTTINSSLGTFPGTLTNGPTWVAGAPFNIFFDTTPPATPTSLTATGGNAVVNLIWTAPADLDVAGYNVYRSESSPVSLTSPVNGGTLVAGTSYIDTGKTNGTPYYYVVTAVDTSANQSVASNEAHATPFMDTTPPAAPTGLTAVPSNAIVTLDWADNAESDLAGYNVYRGTTSGGYAKVNSSLVTASTYSDIGLTNGTEYFYVVRSVDNSANESLDSNEAAAIPQAEAGSALAFTTASGTYVTFGDPVKLDLATFTIETWFKRTGTGTSNTTGSGGIPKAIPLVTHGSPEDDGGNVDADWILVIDDETDVIAADFEDMATGLNHPVLGVTPITDRCLASCCCHL